MIEAKKGDLQLSFPTFLRLYLYLICVKQWDEREEIFCACIKMNTFSARTCESHFLLNQLSVVQVHTSKNLETLLNTSVFVDSNKQTRVCRGGELIILSHLAK